MKPYGVNPRFDQDCCPGHSRFSRYTYNSRRSKKAQTKYTKMAHRIGRSRLRREVRKQLDTFLKESDQ